MLRRTSHRCICEFNFGHPPIGQTFRKEFLNLRGEVPALVDHGVKTATLPNGAKLSTHDRSGLQTTIGFYVEAGAKYDPLAAPGLSYAMRWALLTSSMEDSLFQLDRMFRARGAACTHTEIRKRHIGIRLEARRDMWKDPFEFLATCIAAPRFAESDIERFRDTWDNILEEQRWQNPREYVVDQLERVAFYKEPLGNPRRMLREFNDEATHEKLIAQYAAQFIPQNISVAGVNVGQEELTKAYIDAPYPHSSEAPHFRDARRLSLSHMREGTQFHAGRQEHEHECRAKAMGTKPDMDEEAVVALGWLTSGRDDSAAAYATAAVVHELLAIALSDGISYNRDETHHGVRSFYRPYSSAGLVGVTVRAPPATIAAPLQDAAALVAKIPAAAATSLEAAKARTLMSLYNNELELARDYCDFLGTSVQTEADLAAAIQAVTPDAIAKEVQSIRSSAPSLFATGDVLNFPTLRQLGLHR